jgi:hypothetical protein
MEYGGTVVGATTTVAGASTIAALPETGGSRNVITYVAMASIVLGVAIIASTAVRMIAKRRFNA